MAAIRALRDAAVRAAARRARRRSPALRLWGIADRGAFEERTPTAAVTLDGVSRGGVVDRAGRRGIATWWGNFYAVGPIERLGLEPEGVLRIGLTHYNTAAEVDRLVGELRRDRRRRPRRLTATAWRRPARPTSRSSAAASSARRSPPSSPGVALASSCTSDARSPRAPRGATRAPSGIRPTRSSARCTARPSRATARSPTRSGPSFRPTRRSASSASPTGPPGSSRWAGTRTRLRAQAAAIAEANPAFRAAFVGPDDLRRLEPGLAEGLAAVRLDIGFPVAPAAAARAFAALAVAPRRARSAQASRRGSSRAAGASRIAVNTGDGDRCARAPWS